MNLQSDDFELMGLPRQFALDRAMLDERWKELQKQAHPDRFAGEAALHSVGHAMVGAHQ
jgi:hypothetical protein